MKVFVVLLVLPLALAWPQQHGWENKDGGQDDQVVDFNMKVFLEEFYKHMKAQGGDRSSEEDEHSAGMMQGLSLEQLRTMVQMMEEMKEKQEHKEEMMERFEEWRKEKMEKEQQRREEEEQQREQMEMLYQKQMMVKQLGDLAEKYQEQKMKLVSSVTMQFVEFCQCADSSAMLKRFFSHQFGDQTYEDQWNAAMHNLGSGWEMFSEYKDWTQQSDNMGGMQNSNGSANGNSTFFGNGTMGNGTDSQMGGDMDSEQVKQWTVAAMKFANMTAKQQAQELFKGLVKGMCQRAGEYVMQVQKFESFYVKFMAQQMNRHR